MRFFLTPLLAFPIALAGQNSRVSKNNFPTSAEDQESTQISQVETDFESESASCKSKDCALSSDSYATASAIVRIALKSHPRSARLLDCSHFVHTVYERAGLPYPYASSSDLYLGMNNFRRVSTPQAGDLAVWRGHVGIIVDPAEHTFLSVLHNGPSIDYYDSRYWKHRGRPRFFRYTKRVAEPRSSNAVLSASLTRPEAADVEPDGFASGNKSGVNERNSTADFTRSTAVARVAYSPEWRATVNSARPGPTEIRSALAQASTQLDAELQGRNLFNFDHPVVVFDNFEVVQVHVAKKSGWVDIKVDEVMLLAKGKVQPPSDAGPERWILKRTGKKSWELSQPAQSVYVTQQSAERLISHQLAELTEVSPQAAGVIRQKAELARLLNLLFTK